jgi:hypothetical protein
MATDDLAHDLKDGGKQQLTGILDLCGLMVVRVLDVPDADHL